MKRTVFALILAGSLIIPAVAQDDGDAPDHGVARISVVNGDVAVRRGDSGESSAAVINAPVVMNDRVETTPGARAEVQFDSTNMIRLGPGTEVRMGELQDRRYLVQVATGTATFRVLGNSQAQVEISTPTVSVHPTQPGSYRVSVQPDGQTEISVRLGEAEIFSPRGSEVLRSGQTMQARGNASDPEFQIIAGIPRDDWDQWNERRDQDLQRATTSSRYVGPEVAGTADLDNYGQWQNDPAYGQVWVPTVSAGWAPYREGRWVYVDYYGWTWVSTDPWGWGPYHYGNWYQGSFGWAWYPGPYIGHHYWRPAMVGFFGWGGGGFGGGFGFGNVGWVPLAPFERYRPWYGAGRSFNSATIVNNTNISNVYRNARGLNGVNAITSVHSNEFGRGSSITRNNFVRASGGDLARAGSVQGGLPFNASREGRQLSDRAVNTQALPKVNENTRFASSRNTPGNTQGFGQTAARTANPAPAANTNTGGGWRRLDSPGQNAAQAPRAQSSLQNTAPNNNVRPNNAAPAAQGGNGNSWRRFDPAQTGNTAAGNPAPRVQSSVPNSYSNRAPGVSNGVPNNARPNRAVEAPRSYSPSYTPARPQYTPQQQQQVRPQYTPQQQQPVRINPPMVRERTAPSAPPVSRPAPAPSNFGSARPSSGGGGGSRSSGGHSNSSHHR